MNNTFDNWYGTGQDLEHSGIPGMKWGVRRYQNRDGSLTALGKARYGKEGTGAGARKMQRTSTVLTKAMPGKMRNVSKHIEICGNTQRELQNDR